MTTRSLILILFIMVTAGGGYAQPRPNMKALQEDAARAFEQKNYREAAAKYGQIIASNPKNAVAHFRKGVSHYNLKEYNEAISELTAALDQGFQPAVQAYKVRALSYYEGKNYDATLQDVQRALAITPNDLVLLKSVVEVNLARKSWPETITAGQSVLKIAPNDADTQYDMARAYFALGDVKNQQTAAQAAVTGGTRFPGEAFFLLGDACYKQGSSACAIDAFQKGIAVMPKNLDSYRDLADVYKSENRINDAISTIKKGQVVFPANGYLYLDLSRLYTLADRPDDAVNAAKAVVQNLPTDPAGYTNLCRAYNDTKAYPLAISACNSGLQILPGDGETYFYLARAYDLSGRTAEATKYYGLAVKGLMETTQKNPSSSDSWYVLGNAYFADNQKEKAIDAYLKSLELAPKSIRARYNLGIIYTRTKNKQAAMEQYAALKDLDAKLAESLKSQIDKM